MAISHSMGGTEERELPLGEGGQGQGQVGLGNRQGKEEVVGVEEPRQVGPGDQCRLCSWLWPDAARCYPGSGAPDGDPLGNEASSAHKWPVERSF